MSNTILNSTTLTGVNSIPNFIAPGSLMLFQQSTAPVSWTKQTTHDNKALRVVSGTAGSGGNISFTGAFATRPISGSISSVAAGGSIGGTVAGGSISSVSVSGSIGSTSAGGSIGSTSAGGSVGDHTLSTGRIPGHAHQAGSGVTVGGTSPSTSNITVRSTNSSGPATSSTGGGNSHSHPFSGSSHSHSFSGSSHSHSFSSPGHSHSFTGTSHNHAFTGSPHSHTFTGNSVDFRVLYVDVIIARKN
jgi:hypothetical protein